PAFGRAPSLMALVLMLFLPSCFAWSISALKEPLYFLLSVTCISLAITLVRNPNWAIKLLALAALAAIVAALGTIRSAGQLLSGCGILFALMPAWMIRRPKFIVALARARPHVMQPALRCP